MDANRYGYMRALCRHISAGRCELFVGLYDAAGEAEALGVAPADLPEFLRGAPEGAETQRACAQVGFFERDAHGDDLVIAPARMPGARGPGRRIR